MVEMRSTTKLSGMVTLVRTVLPCPTDDVREYTTAGTPGAAGATYMMQHSVGWLDMRDCRCLLCFPCLHCIPWLLHISNASCSMV